MLMHHLPQAKRLMALIAVAMMAMAASAPTHAEDRASREREALRRAQMALHSAQEEAAAAQRDKASLAQEKTTLAQDKERLDGALKRTQSKVNTSEAQARAAQAKAAQLEADMAALNAKLQAAQIAQEELNKKYQESQQTMTTVRGLLEKSTKAQAILSERNRQLYATGLSAIELLRSEDRPQKLSSIDPFFKLGVVTMDNVAETWRDRLEAARYKDEEQLNP
jgi:chromosome segregation ATPase